MLVSFIHPLAVMLDEGRAVTTYCVIAEEIFGATTEVTEKRGALGGSETRLKAGKDRISSIEPIRAPLDFPLFLRVLSLGDGKPFKGIREMLVKYNNVSGIMWLE
jgi:hypothetical protein